MSRSNVLTLPPRMVPLLTSNPALRQDQQQDPSTATVNEPWYLALQKLIEAINTIGGGFTAGGDLSGTATVQVVIGLQTVPIDAAAPTASQVLTYNGTKWAPATPSVTPGAIVTDPHTLTAPTTNIVASVLPAPANGCLAVKLIQDATGGRLVTWDAASFLWSPGQASIKPNSRATYLFTADTVSGLWEPAAPPMVH